ncbi:hypothetical protein QFC24_006973 [Naganishia onofrii]|uniref:Uncharacterized protein n=1 Tax=Naganishia onofrii TaxID=1851511 RepID=A0ACC2WUA4_9TREE|nr:hypothetical protein QFC24_006973 [Naganishia onofrii]
MLSKPLALITTTTVSVLSLFAAAAASVSLSTRPGLRKARLALHLGVYVGTLAVCSCLGVVYSVVLSLIGQRLNINYLTARSFYYLCSPLVGVKIEVEGREYLDEVLAKAKRGEKGGSAVLVGNHQSFMDILYLGRIFPKRASIMAKRELKWMPLLGWFSALSGAVFVDRKNNKDAVKAMNAAGEAMKRQVLPPISTEGMTAADVHSLADSVREKMLHTLREISTPSPEAAQISSENHDNEQTQDGEEEPLLGRPSSGTYTESTSNETGNIRRRASSKTGSSRGSSASSASSPSSPKTGKSDTLAETGTMDARQLVKDVKDTAKEAVTASNQEEEEEEDEVDEHGAVFVNKPN